jgi:hypothetical protein
MQSESAREQLERWGIPDDIATSAGLFDVPNVKTVYPEMQSGSGIIIPYYNPDGTLRTFRHGKTTQPFARVRWLDQDTAQTGFVKAKPLRYTQPKDTGPQVYFPPFLDWPSISRDVRSPVIITEGEAKGIVGAMHGFPVLALGGVYSFAGPGGVLLPDLEAIEWRQRHAYIVYDSDAATNPDVLAAEARLTHELQTKRGAHVHIVRLPMGENGEKLGLDDYIKAFGAGAFENLLTTAPPLSGLDAKILAMNERYAWITREAMIYDLDKRLLLRKDNFTSGELSSSDVHMSSGGQQGKPKAVSVSQLWLKHPHARRYSEILFRPGDGASVEGEHGPALNLWTGYPDTTPGDVAPFLRMSEYLFKDLPADQRELPLKLMAYKAQNPAEKIPLAIVLIGPQGSGKNVWSDSLMDAFQPYAKAVTPAQLAGEFQNWLETSLLATIHEARPEDMHRASEKLKSLVSDLRRPMNEKFRPVRDVNSYTFYIITSNLRGVGSFAGDDRRYFVVDTPTPGPQDMYDDVWAWRKAGGGKHLLRWLLDYDLQGWKPPQRAPVTAAKHMAYQEGLTPIQKLADDMHTADEHVIVGWLDQAVLWAQSAELSNNSRVASHAKTVAQTVRSFQIRPWYTAEELSLMFPVVVEMILGSKYARNTPAGEVSRQLRDAGVPYLVNRDDVRGFRWQGQMRQYLVVADFDEWSAPIQQEQFEQRMKTWPTYGQIKGSR